MAIGALGAFCFEHDLPSLGSESVDLLLSFGDRHLSD